jgi:hypothetical protein
VASSELELFLRLSRLLVGNPALDQRLADGADGYLARVASCPAGSALDRLLALFHELAASAADPDALHDLVARRIMASDELRPGAAAIILIWLTGAPEADRPSAPTEAQHFSAELWRIIHAHPPALSGGYYGHWAYPPD